jgi:hypothetical protein
MLPDRRRCSAIFTNRADLLSEAVTLQLELEADGWTRQAPEDRPELCSAPPLRRWADHVVTLPYTIDSQRQIAQVTVSGAVRGPDFTDTLLALFHDPRWQPEFNALWDGRGITELLLAPGDLVRVPKILTTSFPEILATCR